ncbi:MAG: hypothetical protein IJB34_01740 [Clostridia bacterium]|nr:hypothetical protein [Clostridia bacterium]
MGYENQRAKLAAIKEENDKLIMEAVKLLDGAIAAEEKVKKKKADTRRERALLASFSDRKTLVQAYINQQGEAYFQGRIENEENFNRFIKSLLPLLKQYEEKAGDPHLSEAEKNELLSAMEQRAEKWIKTKSTEGIMDGQLKEQLLNMIDTTLGDLRDFKDTSLTVTSEDSEDARALADKTMAQLEKYKKLLTDSYYIDTDENQALAQEAWNLISQIRTKIPKMASSAQVGLLLKKLDKVMVQIGQTKNKGKKINSAKVNLGRLGSAEEEDIKAGKADELSSAIYVLERLNVSEEFFGVMEKKIQARLDKMVGGYDLASDPVYQSLRNNANTCADKIRELQKDPKRNEAQIKIYYRQFQGFKKQLEEYQKKKTAEMEKKANKSLSTIKYMEICDKFRAVGELFTGESNVPYAVRARIMASSGMSDFGEMFERYVVAATMGDEETMKDIEIRLTVMRQKFDTEQKLADTSILDEDDLKDEETEGDVDTATEEPLEIDLDGFGTEVPVAEPVPQTPLTDGAVETVNTGAEAEDDISVDDLMGELDGL